jgi:type I restriction enzyme, R subunit
MALLTRGWNEAGQSEDPAIELLLNLGYAYVPPDTLDAERDSLRDVVLVTRLETALRRLNPWLSDDNKHKAVRATTSTQAASLIEANETLHTALTVRHRARAGSRRRA